MSSDKFFQNLASVLGFLRNNPDNGYFSEEIASETNIDKTEVDSVIQNSRANGWVDVDHFTDDGTPAVKINTFGNKKYNSLTGNETSLPAKLKEIHFIHVPQSTFGKVAAICSIVGVPLAIVFFGLTAMGVFDNPDITTDEPEIIESIPSKPIISYEKIWETFEKNRPYELE